MTLPLQKRIAAFSKLGEYILSEPEDIKPVIAKTYLANKWFTKENISKSLKAIASQFLEASELTAWVHQYNVEETTPQTVGLVAAGNIPLVGFHDFLCILMAGHKAQVKLSQKDEKLLPFLATKLVSFEPALKDSIQFVPQLKNFDVIIATGSDNTARYFDYYFGRYPNIIRKNRNSVAILTGKEQPDELEKLNDDIFDYFGLGCRSVSKLYLPKGYELPGLIEYLNKKEEVVFHDKYKNNFDYNYSLFILNKIQHLQGNTVLLREEPSLQSRIGCLHYEFYEDENELLLKIEQEKERIQVIVSHESIGPYKIVPPGKAQQPTLSDYADNIDTMAFLSKL